MTGSVRTAGTIAGPTGSESGQVPPPSGADAARRHPASNALMNPTAAQDDLAGRPPDPGPFPGEGESALACRAHAWGATALGPPEGWTPALRTAAAMITASSQPMAVLWGADRLQIHNAAFRRTVGARTDELGRPAGRGWPGLALDEPSVGVGPGGATLLPLPDGTGGGTLVIVERRGRMPARPVHPSDASDAPSPGPETRRFRKAFRGSPAFMFIAHRDTGRLVEVNQAFCTLTGWARDEVVGRTFRELGLVESERRGEILERLLGSRRVRDEEARIRTRSGDARTVLFSIEPMAFGDEPCVVCTGVDLTEGKRAAEALEESERNFRTLANQIPQLVWMTDHTGSVVWYNQRWYDYTGTTLDEVKGWGWTRVHHADHVDRVVERIRRCFESGEPWEDTFPLRGRNGTYRWFLSRALPIRDEDGRVVRWFGTNTDVTGQRETEAELRRTKDRAEQASLAKSRFLAVMSHELRTPLTGIIGYADLLDAGLAGDLSEKAMLYVERIHAGAKHLTGLIDEILSLSRIEAGTEVVESEEVDLVELVGGVGSLLALRAADKELDFETRLPEEPLQVRTDPGKVRQILLNLLGNAIKFTQQGTVSLEMRRRRGRVEIRIRDTGPGIDPADRERVFEPFHQVDQSNTRAVGGSGLGLSVSRRLARLLGGDVILEDDPPPGSTFVLLLPVT